MSPMTSHEEEWPDFRAAIRKKLLWDKKRVKKRIPILSWLPKYKAEYLINDFIAGLTVALTAIPQGIAYAVIAGLPPQYGLYAEMVPGIIYMVFGSCNYITIGPTAITSLLTQPFALLSPDFAILAAFLVGIIIILFGVFNLGFLVEFISIPVTTGFVAAAAVTIASAQIKSLFGIPGPSSQFLESWTSIVENISEIKLGDSVLGITTVAILIVLKKVGPSKRWPVFCKYFSLSRNALVVTIGTLLAFLISNSGSTIPFAITGDVASGLPPIQPPPFSTELNNQTISFGEMFSTYGSSLITIPIIAILEIFAVAKAFAKGNTVDATQEMLALGMCNVLGSFVSSMPVTGSFTRTALNYASGVNTPLGGIITVIVVLLALGLLTSTFYFIPKAVLAGVIICAVLSMIEYDVVKHLWRTRRLDLFPFFVTLFSSLFLGIDYGILIGIASNLLFILYKSARPEIASELRIVGERKVILITPDQSLYFSSAEYLKFKVKKAVAMHVSTRILVIDGKFIKNIDATTGSGINAMISEMEDFNVKITLWNWNVQPMGVILRTNRSLEGLFKSAPTFEDMISDLYNP